MELNLGFMKVSLGKEQVLPQAIQQKVDVKKEEAEASIMQQAETDKAQAKSDALKKINENSKELDSMQNALEQLQAKKDAIDTDFSDNADTQEANGQKSLKDLAEMYSEDDEVQANFDEEFVEEFEGLADKLENGTLTGSERERLQEMLGEYAGAKAEVMQDKIDAQQDAVNQKSKENEKEKKEINSELDKTIKDIEEQAKQDVKEAKDKLQSENEEKYQQRQEQKEQEDIDAMGL